MQNKVGLVLAILFILSTTGQAQQQTFLFTYIEGRAARGTNKTGSNKTATK